MAVIFREALNNPEASFRFFIKFIGKERRSPQAGRNDLQALAQSTKFVLAKSVYNRCVLFAKPQYTILASQKYRLMIKKGVLNLTSGKRLAAFNLFFPVDAAFRHSLSTFVETMNSLLFFG